MPIADYRRVIDDIAAKIDSGGLRPGQPLPNTKELAAQYGVSESTIERAMSILIDRGTIEGHQGKMRRVAAPRQGRQDGRGNGAELVDGA